MCVIITTESSSSRPSLRDLDACERANPHGSGLAWLRGKRVEYVKGFRALDIHELLSDIEGPAVVHFRIASVGGVRADLCHPFPITHRAEARSRGRARAVLFHNGTWREHQAAAQHFGIRFARGQGVSDTRVAAVVAARLGFEWFQRADYCRWACLSAAGIQRIGDWQEIRGCHYSNAYWLPKSSAGFYDCPEADLFDGEE